MHQQVRTSIRSSGGDAARGTPGEESIVKILKELKPKNLQSAGRVQGEGGGEFVFSIDHADGDNHADVEARDILRDAGYEADVYEVRSFDLKHKEGSLLACIESLEAELDEPVIEVYVLAAEGNAKVPVQLVTRKMLEKPLP